MKFSELVQKLGESAANNSLASRSDHDPDLTGVAAIDTAQPAQLAYLEGDKFAAYLETTAASALILPRQEKFQPQASDRGIAWIVAAQPRLMFAQAIRLFYQPFRPAPLIHPTAVIHPSVELGEEVYIGPRVTILERAKIGNGVCIYGNSVIYPEAQIGDRTLLHAGCVIHERSRLGADCVIHSGAVIGAEGFGFVPSAQGWVKLDQSGYAILEDGVEVGCNSTIDRPAVGETRVARQTKIDNLVHIGHNCQVGYGCALAAQVGIAGSVKIGNRVIFAGQVGVANQVRIEDGAIVSAKTGVHSPVAAGTIVSGIPAVPHKTFLKVSAVFNRLPEIYRSLKQLQRQAR